MKILKSNTLQMLQFSALGGCCNISHFITTREGGVSRGAYASMNPGRFSGDDADSVRENLERLSAAIRLPADRIIAPFQVHRDEVRVLSEEFLALDPVSREAYLSGADALITRLPEICVAVATADCVPVLLYAPDVRAVAAVHAGWRGTVLRIVEKSVRTMVDRYGCDPSQMLAGIGPSISREAFEVGDEVVDAFREAGFDLAPIVSRDPESGKAHIDLWECNRRQLLDAGLSAPHIEVSGICTYTHSDRYFSARRLGIRSGRLLSGIFLHA